MTSWDAYYVTEDSTTDPPSTSSEPLDPEDLPQWFADALSPQKILSYLTSPSFPLSPSHWPSLPRRPCVLDLGTGNGSLLFMLRTRGSWIGNRMCGVDYSARSIELCRRLGREIGAGCEDVEFEVCDVLRDEWAGAEWWPGRQTRRVGGPRDGEREEEDGEQGGWDVVLDKGTFDAVSLSSETVAEEPLPSQQDHSRTERRTRRVVELYPSIAAQMVKKGGFLLVTSCNWTEDELIRWFCPPYAEKGEQNGARLEVFDRLKYSSFRFGGGEGQGVCSICFRRVR